MLKKGHFKNKVKKKKLFLFFSIIVNHFKMLTLNNEDNKYTGLCKS